LLENNKIAQTAKKPLSILLALMALTLTLPISVLASPDWLLFINSNDFDLDRDGLSRAEEEELGTDWQVADTDGDGIPDGEEYALGTTPLAVDTDLDGLEDALEQEIGQTRF
jgi:hypothetical protein